MGLGVFLFWVWVFLIFGVVYRSGFEAAKVCGALWCVRFQTFEHGDGRGSMEGSGRESDAIGVELIEECNGGGAHRDANDQRAAVDR